MEKCVLLSWNERMDKLQTIQGISARAFFTINSMQSIRKMKTLYASEIKNPKELRILQLLKSRGAYLYGDIFKELSISSSEGQHIIFSMLSRGLIKFQYCSSSIELNVELK